MACQLFVFHMKWKLLCVCERGNKRKANSRTNDTKRRIPAHANTHTSSPSPRLSAIKSHLFDKHKFLNTEAKIQLREVCVRFAARVENSLLAPLCWRCELVKENIQFVVKSVRKSQANGK